MFLNRMCMIKKQYNVIHVYLLNFYSKNSSEMLYSHIYLDVLKY